MSNTKNIKKLLLCVTCAAVMLFGCMSMCFAESSTKVLMDIDAADISITVTESITMSGDGKSPELSINSNYEVTNNNAVGLLEITNLEVQTLEGWTIKPFDTDWSALAANSNQFGMKLDEMDMVSAQKDVATIAANGTATFDVTAMTGAATSAINEQVANIVVTVGYVTASDSSAPGSGGGSSQ